MDASLLSPGPLDLPSRRCYFFGLASVSFGPERLGFIDVCFQFAATCRVPPGGILQSGLVMRRASGPPCLPAATTLSRCAVHSLSLRSFAPHFVRPTLRCAQSWLAVALGSRRSVRVAASCRRWRRHPVIAPRFAPVQPLVTLRNYPPSPLNSSCHFTGVRIGERLVRRYSPTETSGRSPLLPWRPATTLSRQCPSLLNLQRDRFQTSRLRTEAARC